MQEELVALVIQLCGRRYTEPLVFPHVGTRHVFLFFYTRKQKLNGSRSHFGQNLSPFGQNLSQKNGRSHKEERMVYTIADFRDARSTEDRTAEAKRIRAKYPDRVPVVACRDANAHGMPEIDKRKYLIPTTMTVGEFCFVLRKRMSLGPSKAMFLFCEQGILPPTSATILDVYIKHKHHDDFLYFTYASENTFGLQCVIQDGKQHGANRRQGDQHDPL